MFHEVHALASRLLYFTMDRSSAVGIEIAAVAALLNNDTPGGFLPDTGRFDNERLSREQCLE